MIHPATRNPQRATRNGFTIIEVLITVSIFSVVAVSVYSAFAGGMNVWKRETRFKKTGISSRILLEKMTRDLRNMIPFSGITGTGDKKSVSFPGLIKTLSEDSEFYYQIGKITYSFDSSDNDILRNEEEYGISLQSGNGKGKKVLSGIESFTLSYYIYDTALKEYNWANEWDGEDEKSDLFGVQVDITYQENSNKNATLSKTIFFPRGRIL